LTFSENFSDLLIGPIPGRGVFGIFVIVKCKRREKVKLFLKIEGTWFKHYFPNLLTSSRWLPSCVVFEEGIIIIF
jgi:hypothetical protein